MARETKPRASLTELALYPEVDLQTVLGYLRVYDGLPKASCKLDGDRVVLHKWERHNGKLKLEFTIVEEGRSQKRGLVGITAHTEAAYDGR